MAIRCSGAAAVTSLQEQGVICGHDRGQVWLSMGRGKEISYLEHLFWVTETVDSGDLQREGGRAAAGWFFTPGIILQIIYLTLCRLNLISQKLPRDKSLLSLPDHVRTEKQLEATMLQFVSKEKALPARNRGSPSPSSTLLDVHPAQWWG